MKKFVSTLLAMFACAAMVTGASFAQEMDDSIYIQQDVTTVEADVDPDLTVANLEPFTPEANFMSLPGFYRYQYYAATGIWLDRDTAVAAVDNQMEAATR